MTRTVTDILRKVEGFKKLEDGWYETHSKATNHELVDFVYEIIALYVYDDDVVQWAVAPTGDGGITFESSGIDRTHVWDIDLHYDSRPRVDQWVLTVLEVEDYRVDGTNYNELEFRSRTLSNETFSQFFRRALEKRIFTWE